MSISGKFDVAAYRNGVLITDVRGISRQDAWAAVQRAEKRAGSVFAYVYRNAQDGSRHRVYRSVVDNSRPANVATGLCKEHGTVNVVKDAAGRSHCACGKYTS